MYFSITMRKQLFYLIFLISAFGFSQNQKITSVKQDFIAIEADDFIGFDGFGNYFYIKNNIVFKKIDTETLQYQNLSLGNLTRVDILNPLKVILFYEEFNSVIILDNFMNEIQKIEFSKLETPIVATAIGISGQNNLWIYNALNQQIGLFDLTTGTYKNLGVPIKETIPFYQSDFNYFHWIDNQNQWNTCTIFGRVFTHGRVELNLEMQLLNENKIIFSDDNKMYLRDRNINKLYEIEIVEKSFKKFYYKDQILSIFTDKGIINYKIILP